ncbi:MAG: VWA domain-containing protein [Proteobacteria bacterium]|nr:VWA domain-containing protein [Pseudomonadota bacterium]
MNSDAWQVRSVVYYFCRRVRDLSSIPLIIDSLPAEKGRLRAEAMTTLRSLTLLTYRQPSQWKRWWDSIGAEFKLPPAPAENHAIRGARASMTYYSIPLTSKAVYFLIDTSSSMSAKVGTAKITRLQAAKDALKYVIGNCAPDFHFNLIPFSGTGRAWKTGLTPASGEHKQAALNFVKAFRASGGTNIYDALKQAFADQSVDVVFANLLLPWVNEPAEVTLEVSRVLRKDGLFVFASLGPDSLLEIRNAWAGVDDCSHVNRFLDMHDVGDLMVRAGLSDPVLDVDRLTVSYKDADDLFRDLTAAGARNSLQNRNRSLVGRQRFGAMRQRLENTGSDGTIELDLELVYGHCWGGRPPLPEGDVRIDASAIAVRKR